MHTAQCAIKYTLYTVLRACYLLCSKMLINVQMSIISKLQEQYDGPRGLLHNKHINPFEAQRVAGIGDRRFLGKYDARFHSTTWYPPSPVGYPK